MGVLISALVHCLRVNDAGSCLYNLARPTGVMCWVVPPGPS